MRALQLTISLFFSAELLAMTCAPAIPMLDDKYKYASIFIGDVVGTSLPNDVVEQRRQELKFDAGRRYNMYRSTAASVHSVKILVAEVIKGSARESEFVEVRLGGCSVEISRLMSRGVFFIEPNNGKAIAIYDDTPRKLGDLYSDWVLRAREYAR